MLDIKGRYEEVVQNYADMVDEYGKDAQERIATSSFWNEANALMNSLPGCLGRCNKIEKTIANEIDNTRMTVAERNEAMKLNASENQAAFKKMRGAYYRNVNRINDAAKAKVEADFPSNSVLFSLSKTARDKIFSDVWNRAYENEHSNGLYHVMSAYNDALDDIENILGIAKKDWSR